MQKTKNTISRRGFLKASGEVALFIGVSGILPQLVSCRDADKMREQLEKHPVTAWVKLSEDGGITICNPAAEMGQGSMTSLPVVFAEEFDADWSKVSVAFSPQEAEIYGSEGWTPGSKLMMTVGSRTTHSYWPVMRKAGAQARYVLMSSAAALWGVPVSEVTTSESLVKHEKSGKQMGYGELVPHLVMPEDIPLYFPFSSINSNGGQAASIPKFNCGCASIKARSSSVNVALGKSAWPSFPIDGTQRFLILLRSSSVILSNPF
jgi:isoquinoline 1-oxidoreductase beta subunit